VRDAAEKLTRYSDAQRVQVLGHVDADWDSRREPTRTSPRWKCRIRYTAKGCGETTRARLDLHRVAGAGYQT